jgi:hypothetical protein
MFKYEFQKENFINIVAKTTGQDLNSPVFLGSGRGSAYIKPSLAFSELEHQTGLINPYLRFYQSLMVLLDTGDEEALKDFLEHEKMFRIP